MLWKVWVLVRLTLQYCACKGIKDKTWKKGKAIEVDGVEDAVQKAAKENESINKQNVEMAMDKSKVKTLVHIKTEAWLINGRCYYFY